MPHQRPKAQALSTGIKGSTSVTVKPLPSAVAPNITGEYLPTVTVKTPSVSQTATPSFLDKATGWLNENLFKKLKPQAEVNAKVDDKTLYIIGAIAIAVALIFNSGKRK